MTERDMATLVTLQVHTVLDLRSEPEVATRGIGPVEYATRTRSIPRVSTDGADSSSIDAWPGSMLPASSRGRRVQSAGEPHPACLPARLPKRGLLARRTRQTLAVLYARPGGVHAGCVNIGGGADERAGGSRLPRHQCRREHAGGRRRDGDAVQRT